MGDELKADLMDLGAEFLELGVDQLLDDGVLKDVPLVGTAVKLASAVMTIKDRIFLSKVKKFITALPYIDEQEKQKFRDDLASDPKLRAKTGETIVLILDRFDDMGKPELLAKIFGAFVAGDIDLEDFRRLATAVDLAYIEDLKKFGEPPSIRWGTSREPYASLVRTGLTAISEKAVVRTDVMDNESIEMPLVLTRLGSSFQSIRDGFYEERRERRKEKANMSDPGKEKGD